MWEREEEEEVANGVHEMNIAGVKNGIRDAEQEKERGNRAFVNKDRKKAVDHYTKAIDCLLDAESQKPTDVELVKIKAVEAVCFSNRAASWLLPGQGQDAQKALADADRAIEEDCEYAKASVFPSLCVSVRMLTVLQVLSQGKGFVALVTQFRRNRHAY